MRAPRRAPQILPKSAHDDDEKGLHDERGVHAEGDAHRGRHEGAAEPGEEAADHEDGGEDPAHVDADGPDHLPVDRRRPCDIFPIFVLFTRSQRAMATTGPMMRRKRL